MQAKFRFSKIFQSLRGPRIWLPLSILFLFSLVLPFQNCTGGLNSQTSNLNAFKFHSGNGGGYEGKLTVAITYKNEIRYTDKLEMNSGESITYHIEGGVPPYQFELKGQGSLDVENSRYTAPYFKESPTTERLSITDSVGAKAEIQLIVYSFIGSSRIYYPAPGSPTDTYWRPILVDSRGVLYNFNLFFDYQQNLRFELRKSFDQGGAWTFIHERMYFSSLEKPCELFSDIKDKFSFIIDDQDHLYAFYEFRSRVAGECGPASQFKKIVLKSADGGVTWNELPNEGLSQDLKQLQSKSYREILAPEAYPAAGISKSYSIQDKISFVGPSERPDAAITHLGADLQIRIASESASQKNTSMKRATLIDQSTDRGQSWLLVDRHNSISQLGGIFAARDYLDLGGGKIIAVGFGTDKSDSPGWEDKYWTRWVTYISDDGGDTWVLSDLFVLPQGYHSNAEKVVINSRQEIFVLGVAQYGFANQVWTLRKSTDFGKTWKTVDTQESSSFFTLTAIPKAILEFKDYSLLVAGEVSSSTSTTQRTDIVLKRSVSAGETWLSIGKRSENFVKMIKCFQSETVYLLTSKNIPVEEHSGHYDFVYHLYKSEDRGSVWSEISIGSSGANLTGTVSDMICDENKIYLFSNDWLKYGFDSEGQRILIEDPRHLNSVLTMDGGSGVWTKNSFTTNSRFIVNSVTLINNMFWFAGAEVVSFQSRFPFEKEQEWRVVKSNLSFTRIFLIDHRQTDVDPGLESEFRSQLPSYALLVKKCNSVRLENQPSDMDSICVMGLKSMGETRSDRSVYSTLRVLRTPARNEN